MTCPEQQEGGRSRPANLALLGTLIRAARSLAKRGVCGSVSGAVFLPAKWEAGGFARLWVPLSSSSFSFSSSSCARFVSLAFAAFQGGLMQSAPGSARYMSINCSKYTWGLREHLLAWGAASEVVVTLDTQSCTGCSLLAGQRTTRSVASRAPNCGMRSLLLHRSFQTGRLHR